ncbi:hypothetical protein [Algoriphagus sp. AK58]|uniref:hypothetical protein n=1 Tax=Algoriphagus sp. AK58 TaxID=1406877 RepID=UPI00164FAF10|nr:hypothetical protein [Algoriphagus sp. AK58]
MKSSESVEWCQEYACFEANPEFGIDFLFDFGLDGKSSVPHETFPFPSIWIGGIKSKTIFEIEAKAGIDRPFETFGYFEGFADPKIKEIDIDLRAIGPKLLSVYS